MLKTEISSYVAGKCVRKFSVQYAKVGQAAVETNQKAIPRRRKVLLQVRTCCHIIQSVESGCEPEPQLHGGCALLSPCAGPSLVVLFNLCDAERSKGNLSRCDDSESLEIMW